VHTQPPWLAVNNVGLKLNAAKLKITPLILCAIRR